MDVDRFWSRVKKTDECWEWTGARVRRSNGVLSYGHIRVDGVIRPTHRLSWELERGPIPDGLWVLHHCDNQGCVRPDHLYLGTHADNTRDAIIRRRMSYGEQLPQHKLRDVDVRAIRALYEADFPTEKIGEIFGVSGRTVRYIRDGKHWRDVT